MLGSYLRTFWGWKGLSACVFFAIILLSNVACQNNSEAMNDAIAKENLENPEAPGTPENPGKPGEPGELPSAFVSLSWENSRVPERRNWSRFVVKMIGEKFSNFDQVRDMDIFCPSYKHLERDEKINVWGMLISEIAYFESGWDPTNRFLESGMGRDPVTGAHVYSEGLLQLSYQDAPYRRGDCDFNWQKDRALPPRDPRRTILNPYINLKCGINILEDQIASRRAIVLSSGVYWSTLRSYSSKVSSIAKRIKGRLKFCN